jgi:hypothetical protein
VSCFGSGSGIRLRPKVNTRRESHEIKAFVRPRRCDSPS